MAKADILPMGSLVYLRGWRYEVDGNRPGTSF